jgi:hypothetical protein
MDKFNYENTEIVAQKGGKIVRKVSIKKGRGYKSVTKYRRGKKMYSMKKPIHTAHMYLIQKGKFIPGLFGDCKQCKKNNTKKKRGGSGDIEMGPDIQTEYMSELPPDPERERLQMLRAVQSSFKPVSADEVTKVFNNPTPEQKTVIEGSSMMDEDPLYKEPFQQEELEIFKRGGRRRKRITRRKIRNQKNKRYSRKGGDKIMSSNYNLEEDDDYMPMEQDIQQEDHNMDADNNLDPRLEQLLKLSRDTEDRIEALDNQLHAIEEMSNEEREQHKEEEERLKKELKDLINTFEDFKEYMVEIFGPME